MSAVEHATMAPVQDHVELHNRQRRRHGKGDIFEHVDVPLLMKKLNLEDSSRTSCSSCPRSCAGDVRTCPLLPISKGTPSAGTPSAGPGLEEEEQDSIFPSASCDRLKDSDVQCISGTQERCFQRLASSADDDDRSAESPSLSRAGLPQGSNTTSSSSSSCAFLKAESEATDHVDNSHAVLAIRPEVCAKRSLIF